MTATSIRAGVVGRRVFPERGLFHLSGAPGDRQVVYLLWAVTTRERVIVVDTGFSERVAAQRGIDSHVPPGELLRRMGLDAGEVDDVVVSHLHFDHFADPGTFPRATFHIQRAEVEYFLGRGRQHPVHRFADTSSLEALAELIDGGRVNLLDGPLERLGPATLMHVGGHTPGSQIVVLDWQGSPVVLACDAAHTYDNLLLRTPAPAFHNYDECQRAFATVEILAQGGMWFPGHDATTCERLQAAGDAVYELPAVG